MNRSYAAYWSIIWECDDYFSVIDGSRGCSPLESWLSRLSEDHLLKIEKQIDEQKAVKGNIIHKTKDIESLLKQQCCDVPSDSRVNMWDALMESFDYEGKLKDILSNNGFDDWYEMEQW